MKETPALALDKQSAYGAFIKQLGVVSRYYICNNSHVDVSGFGCNDIKGFPTTIDRRPRYFGSYKLRSRPMEDKNRRPSRTKEWG